MEIRITPRLFIHQLTAWIVHEIVNEFFCPITYCLVLHCIERKFKVFSMLFSNEITLWHGYYSALRNSFKQITVRRPTKTRHNYNWIIKIVLMNAMTHIFTTEYESQRIFSWVVYAIRMPLNIKNYLVSRIKRCI